MLFDISNHLFKMLQIWIVFSSWFFSAFSVIAKPPTCVPCLHPRHSQINLLIIRTESKLPGPLGTCPWPVSDHHDSFCNKNDAYKRTVQVGITGLYESWVQVLVLIYTVWPGKSLNVSEPIPLSPNWEWQHLFYVPWVCHEKQKKWVKCCPHNIFLCH